MTRTAIRASQCKHLLGFHSNIHFHLPLVRLDRTRPLCPECIRYGVKIVEPQDNLLDGLYETGVMEGVIAQADFDMRELDAADERRDREVQAQMQEQAPPPPVFPAETTSPMFALPGGGLTSTLAFRSGPPPGTFGLSQAGQQVQHGHYYQQTQAPGQTAQAQQQPDYLASILSTYKEHHLDTYYPYANTGPSFPAASSFPSDSTDTGSHFQQQQNAQNQHTHSTPSTTTIAHILKRLSLNNPTYFNPFAPDPSSMPQDTYFSTIRTVPAQEDFIRAGNEGFLLQVHGTQRPFSAQDWANCVKMRMCETGATNYAVAERELWETIERVTSCLPK